MKKNATGLCLNGRLSQTEAPLPPGTAGVRGIPKGLGCGHHSSSEASALHKLLESLEDVVSIHRLVSSGHWGLISEVDSPKMLTLEPQSYKTAAPGRPLL